MPDDAHTPLPMHAQEKDWRPERAVPMDQRLASGTKSPSGVFDVTKAKTAGVSFAHRFSPVGSTCLDCGVTKDDAYELPTPCKTTELPS